MALLSHFIRFNIYFRIVKKQKVLYMLLVSENGGGVDARNK